ncbi:MAG: hypothetical protein OXC69_09085 [Candidatus Tectomicrobia bacterium]|nr:hypothetical protein [Candidatus Tectomicrobia bacterium]
MEEWSRKGVPQGYSVPKSLNKAREWVDESLGIRKIGSPSSFTTTHCTHGRSVEQIAKLIDELHKPKRVDRGKSSIRQQLAKQKAISREYQLALVESANQYASMAVKYRDARRDLRIVTQHRDAAEDEIRSLQDKVRLGFQPTRENKLGNVTLFPQESRQRRSALKQRDES